MTTQDHVMALLRDNSYTLVYNDMVKMMEGDVLAAFLLSRFISLESHFKTSGQLMEGEWFYQSAKSLEVELGINSYQQRQGIKTLKTLGYLDYEMMGFPKRRYIKLNAHGFMQDLSSTQEKTYQTQVETSYKAFYEKLNKAWELVDFKEALDKIPPDIGEFMFAWTHGFKFIWKFPWVWKPRDFGILKQYWNGTYRKVQLYDYSILEKYFIRKHAVETCNISDWINFDKSTPDQFGRISLKQHRTNKEIFR